MIRNFAYKFRIYPTQEQEVLINKTFGCVRYTYNQLLANAKKEHEEKTYQKYIESIVGNKD